MWSNSIPLFFYLVYITQSGVQGGGYGGGKQEDKVIVEVPKKKVYEEPKVYKEPEVWKEEPKVWKEEPKVYKEPEVWKEEPKVWKEEVKVYKKPVVYEEPKKEIWKEEEPEVWKGDKDKEWWKKERKEKWRKKKEERWQKKKLWKQKKHHYSGKRDTSAVSFIDEQFHRLTKRDGYGYGNEYGGGYDKKQSWKEQKKWKKQKKWEEKQYKKKWGKRSLLEKRGGSGYGKVPKFDVEPQEYDDDVGADYDKEILAKEVHQLQEDTQDGYGKQDQYYDQQEPLDTKYGAKEILVSKGSGGGYGAPKVVEKVVIKKHQEPEPIVIKEEYTPEIKEYGPKKELLITEESHGDKYGGYGEPEIIQKKVEKVVIKEHVPPPRKVYEPEPVVIKEEYVPVIKEEYEPEPVVIKEEYKPEPVVIKEEYQPKPVVVESSGYGHKKIIKKVEKEYVKPVVVEEVKHVYPEPEYVPEQPVIIKERPSYKQKEIITTKKTHTIITTPVCNKLMDGLLESLQPEFQEHMSHYKINRVEPIRLSRWGRIQLHDGHLNQFGRICRREDFQAKPFGKSQYLIEGVIQVPEPKCEFMADAHMYNRLKLQNECIRLAAKDATFKVQMLIDKRRGKVHVAELEPLALNGFHLEDEKGRSKNLKWPFSRVSPWQLEPHKYQFMTMLTHELCDKFREMIHRPEVVQEIISQV